MFQQRIHQRSRKFGSLFGGLILIELGTLQFFRAQFGIEWSAMWPLFLIVPGLTLVFGPMAKADARGQD